MVFEEVEVWGSCLVLQWCRTPSGGEVGAIGLDSDEDMEVIPTEDPYTRLLREWEREW